MITKTFALKLFDAFNIQRWNDRIRPVSLCEMDKSAHKMIIAYFLGNIEEKNNNKEIDWNYIIYGGLFALLKNIVLSDIKSSVHKRIKLRNPSPMNELNKWVIEQYEPIITDKELLNEFEKFLNENRDKDDINLNILKASHKYASLREFEIIKHANMSFPYLEKIEDDIRAQLNNYINLTELGSLINKQGIYKLLCQIEQLRYQIRWGQSPRIPSTSVLGHSMLVACISILLSREKKACSKRLYNNFFCGLFHDLPEAVTRDIISPVKKATTDFPDIIKEIEQEIIREELLNLIPDNLKDEIEYYIIDEFENKFKMEGRVLLFDKDKSKETKPFDNYNEDSYSPLDGNLVKLADDIAAFLEAYQSEYYGIHSSHLKDGIEKLKTKYLEHYMINDIDVRSFFMEFNN